MRRRVPVFCRDERETAEYKREAGAATSEKLQTPLPYAALLRAPAKCLGKRRYKRDYPAFFAFIYEGLAARKYTYDGDAFRLSCA